MATISDERLREMEEEMDRFEAEIEGPQDGGDDSSFVLGSSTFDRVQAQLTAIRQDMSAGEAPRSRPAGRPPPPPPPQRISERNQYGDEDYRQRGAGHKRKHDDDDHSGDEFYDIDERPGRPQGPRIGSSSSAPPPPPPPPQGGIPPGPPSNRFAPPPPPPSDGPHAPPPRPAFMPPQLRHRAPRPPFPPRPPGMMRGGPPGGGFGPPPPPPPPGINYGQPGGPHRLPGPPQPMGGGPYPGPMGPGLGPMHPQFQQHPHPQMSGPGGPMPGPMGGPPGQMMGPGPARQEPPRVGGPMGQFMAAPTVGVNQPGQISAGPTTAVPGVEQQKVVYAAAPVVDLSKKKEEKKKKKKKKKTVDTSSETNGNTAPSTQEDTRVADMEVAPDNQMVGGIVATPAPPVPGMMDPMTMAQMGMNPAGMMHGMPNQMMAGMTMTTTTTVMPAQAAGGAPGSKKDKKKKDKKFIRHAANTTWEDPTLAEWSPDDFRMFCGDLGNEVTDETLVRAFSKFPSFLKAKVVRDRRTNKTKGYGFVSFKDPVEFTRAMREMNGKYVGNRPIKLRKSTWKDRSLDVVRKKDKEKKRLGLK